MFGSPSTAFWSIRTAPSVRAVSINGASAVTTIVLVRHAEKADEPKDPGISPAGQRRAEALVRELEKLEVGSAYLVKVEPGSAGAKRTIGPNVEVEPGFVYRLCRNATTICVTPFDGDPASGASGNLENPTTPASEVR